SDSINTNLQKVLVIGLGQLGLPVAKYVLEKGFDVYGYDINNETMIRAKQKIGIKTTTSFKDFDIYIICISTHNPSDIYSPQIDGLFSVINKISLEAKNGSLVSIESTIPQGTSKKVFELLEHRLHVVHAPHRWYSLDEQNYGVNQLRVIGGVNPCCLKMGLEFYNGNSKSESSRISNDEDILLHYSKLENNNIYVGSSQLNFIDDTFYSQDNILDSKNNKSLEIPMHAVSSIEIAELTKIIENSHRYLQIAFAEELYLYCQANNIHFSDLREALNTKWNVDILEPRDGIGGHCLPKDTRMFLNSSKMKSKILQSAIEVDSIYRDFRSRHEKKIITSIENLKN
ncbi:MAG TPA: NAD(P)-binding domain-containing protein, partial [Nitrososphaeraceae archaeon]|nr:NAD(P)-binding domain-containing protein [Nitrososphaeraceae archaeon]